MDAELKKRRRFSEKERARVLQKTACKCGRCGKKLDLHEATIDHIVPMNKGGLNDEYNLIGLCEDCNETKNNFLYNIKDYYKYILPEYIDSYYEYHAFVTYDIRRHNLFNYDTHKYVIYSDKQKTLLSSMVKRRAKKSQIAKMASRMGISVYLAKAYPGDAKEIMELITHCINNEAMIVQNSIYKNDYMIKNEIEDGEVYVLRSNVEKKICGVFLFKRINDETIQLPQLQNIAMNTALRAKYIMTGAYVDYFARDCFDMIMQDVMDKMMRRKAIPIYFDILSYMFVDKNECVRMPYNLDGTDGTLEFMPLKYIRKTMREEAVKIAKETKEELTEDEIDLYTELLINYRNESELKNKGEEVDDLFKKHKSLLRMFKPETCNLYGIGFTETKEGE